MKKSKICINCGFSKPIEEFILGVIDTQCGKKESALCRECRQEDMRAWKTPQKKSEKQDLFADYLKTPQKHSQNISSKTTKKKHDKITLFDRK